MHVKTRSIRRKRILKVIITLLAITIIAVPVYVRLDYINFRVSKFFKGGDLFKKAITYDEHKDDFNLLVTEIFRFIDEQPNFFDEFSGNCDVTENGLLFYKHPYPVGGEYFHEITTKGWTTVDDYKKSFPDDFYAGEVKGVWINPQYPDYIFFSGAWVLVYNRKGKRPNDLIDSYWEKYDYVQVIKHARDWYELYPAG